MRQPKYQLKLGIHHDSVMVWFLSTCFRERRSEKRNNGPENQKCMQIHRRRRGAASHHPHDTRSSTMPILSFSASTHYPRTYGQNVEYSVQHSRVCRLNCQVKYFTYDFGLCSLLLIKVQHFTTDTPAFTKWFYSLEIWNLIKVQDCIALAGYKNAIEPKYGFIFQKKSQNTEGIGN